MIMAAEANKRATAFTRSGARVQHVVSSVDNPAAGTSYSVLRLTDAVETAGYGVELLALNYDPANRPAEGHLGSARLRTFPLSSKFGRIGPRVGYSREMFQYCSRSKPDIVHLHGLWMLPNIVPAYTARRHSTPVIISPHGMLGREALRYSWFKKELMLFLCQRAVLKQAVCLRATAASEVEEIRAIGLRQPVALIPNGIDLPTVGGAKAQQKYLLSLGRVHPKKGLTSLVLAWERQAARFPDWSLRIVGPDELGHKQDLTQLISTRCIPRVSVEEPAFGNAKWSLMSDAGVFVLPTLNENFANTVAESLSVGVPVISTKGAPWAGLAKHGCGWWVDGDVETLSATLHSAMALPEDQRLQMGKRGRLWMEREFVWDSLGRRMAAVYDWALGAGEPTNDIIFS